MKIDKSYAGYFFISPFLFVFLIFGLYPIVITFVLSFQKWDGLMPAISNGINNYARILSDGVFYLSLWNTIRIWTCNFIPQILVAMLLSGIFSFNHINGMKFFRAAYYLPNLITAASVGLLFNLLINGDKSVINHLLVGIGVDGAPFSFYQSKSFTSAMVSYIQWWMWYGYTTIIIMAGMTTINKNIYEAAMIDGATQLQAYTRITIPLIRPTLIYITITSIIGGMQLFDVPATLTNGFGDPQKAILTTSMYIYNQGFKSHNLGYASTVSVGLFITIALLSILAFKSMQRKASGYVG